jgi:hypothetical protein
MRDLTFAMQTEVGKTKVAPFLLFEGDFISGTVRAWSGYGNLTWRGVSWTGTGTLLAVSNIVESNETTASGITVTLNGIPSELISLALGEIKQGASGKIYLGMLDGQTVINDPILLFSGKLDIPAISDEGETAEITITYESRLIDLERARVNRYTPEDQKRLFPGDLGLDYVPAIQDKKVVWGRK